MSTLKNVVVVNDFSYVQGGASAVAIDTANLLCSVGLKVYFFCGDSTGETVLDKKVEVISTGQGEALKDKNRARGIKNGLYNRGAEKKLRSLLARLDPKETIVHVHGWTKSLSSSVFKVVFEENFPVVLTLHDYFTACPNGGFFNYRKKEICDKCAMGLSCRLTNCDSRNYLFKIYRLIRQDIQNTVVKLPKELKNVIAVSEFSAKILREYLNEDVNLEVINNPVAINVRSRTRAEQNRTYLYIGRLDLEKGVDVFCNGVSKAGVEGVVVGDGILRQDLERKYKNIQFVGWQTEESVNGFLKKARCLIFPSLWYEAMGLNVVKALRMGVPVMASEGITAGDYVEDNVNGILFKRGDAEDLSRKIKVLEDDMKVEILSHEAFENFNTDSFSTQKYIERLVGLYEKILEKNDA